MVFFKGKSQSKMDDDWGYPYFRKPPHVCMLNTKQSKTHIYMIIHVHVSFRFIEGPLRARVLFNVLRGVFLLHLEPSP